MANQNGQTSVSVSTIHKDVRRFTERMATFCAMVKLRTSNPKKDGRPVFPRFQITTDIQTGVWKAQECLQSADLNGAISALTETEIHFVNKIFAYGRRTMKKMFDARLQSLVDMGCDRSTMTSLRAAVQEFSSLMGTNCNVDQASDLCWRAWNMLENAHAQILIDREQSEMERVQDEERRRAQEEEARRSVCLEASEHLASAIAEAFGPMPESKRAA